MVAHDLNFKIKIYHNVSPSPVDNRLVKSQKIPQSTTIKVKKSQIKSIIHISSPDI